MTETLSIRIDPETKRRLDALSKRSKRSKSNLAIAAINAYIDLETSHLSEIEAGIADVDAGREVSHEKVAAWLKTWGKPGESKAPQ